MELRQLELFVAAAEERHFTRAARRLNIVQSGLSAAVRALEQELGAALFVRTTRRVELTAAGEALLVEARRVLAAARAARDAVADVQRLARGRLAIGAPTNLPSLRAHLDLPTLLQRYRGEHPGVELRLRQAGSAQLLRELRDGRLDIAFVAWAGPAPESIAMTKLACDPLVFVCAPSHPLAARSQVSLARLREEAFVEFHQDWGARFLTDAAFAAAGVSRRIALEVYDRPTLLALVEHGLGVAVVPRAMTALSVRARVVPLRVVPLRGTVPHWTLYAATPDGRPVSPAARALLALLALLSPPGRQAAGAREGRLHLEP